jgi:hypothetical protein
MAGSTPPLTEVPAFLPRHVRARCSRRLIERVEHRLAEGAIRDLPNALMRGFRFDLSRDLRLRPIGAHQIDIEEGVD